MLVMNNSTIPDTSEDRARSLRELQDERDLMLADGRLRLAAELTTWIDELMAESPVRGT